MARQAEKKGLGRGLSALLGEELGGAASLDDIAGAPDDAAAHGPSVAPIEMIHPNPDQPRRDFPEDELDELAASIRERGIIQPVIVRPDPRRAGDYQIVAGERRWRAAQRARLHEIPIILRDFDDRTVLEVALIENLQRSDLNAVEEAQAYQSMIDAHGYTQETLARIVGKSRSHIANTLRLLALPGPVLSMLRAGRLSAGHARAVVGAPNAVELAQQAASRGMSVRQIEKLARKGPAGGQASVRTRPRPEKDADTRLLEGDLSAAIGLHVSIEHDATQGHGELRIRYRSLDDLDRLCRKLAE